MRRTGVPSDGWRPDWSAVPADSEAHRLLLNRRVGYVGRVWFFLSLAFYVRNVALIAFMEGRTPPFAHPALVLHAMAGLLAAMQWLSCRGQKRSVAQLNLIDAGGLLGTMALYGGLTVAEARGFEHAVAVESAGAEVLLVGIIMVAIVLTHAIIVPATVRRMFWVSTAACALGAAAAYGVAQVGFPAELLAKKPWLPLNQAAYVAMWGVYTVAGATIAARVIHGLQQRVRDADEIGQYRLVEKIGEGGMGVVYLAQHALLRRPTAVKLLPTEHAGESAVKRFEQEVQLTSALTHPNTIAIYDFGRTSDGVFYYVMEYLDGLTLEDLVTHAGAQPPARVVHILVQICGALTEAHAAGLIHRDIKPANLMLTVRGGVPDHVKVLDFGLVKTQVASDGDAGLSMAGALVGTPAYLPPEAIANPLHIDSRSDLYALGAVGYFLLTGVQVFEAKTVVEICAHHLHSQPVRPSIRLGAPIPASLESLVLSCLAKDPADRPASASVLGQALAALGDVDPWSARDGQGWWDTQGASVRAAAMADRGKSSGSLSSTVAVDLRDRL
jgi:hypothetical protein